MGVAVVHGPVNPLQVAAALTASAPNGGIVRDDGDGTFTVDYPDLTASQITTAVNGVTYDATWVPPTVANSNTLRQRALNALAANATYQAIATPTNAQVIAQVALLTKECNGIIRLLLNQLDTTSGT